MIGVINRLGCLLELEVRVEARHKQVVRLWRTDTGGPVVLDEANLIVAAERDRILALLPSDAGELIVTEAHKLLIEAGTELLTNCARDQKPQQPNRVGRAREMFFDEAEPWEDAVDGPVLGQAIESGLSAFVVLPPGALVAITLWIIMTHVVDAFSYAPYLLLVSPQKRCGKTRVLEILSVLTCRPLQAANVTPAALFRTIERYAPTLLLDEADTWVRSSDDMRGILNAEFQRGGQVLRLVGEGHEPQAFSVYGAKALASIGSLPDTISDRGIVIPMQRRTRDEPILPWRTHRSQTAMGPLRRQIARWALDNKDSLSAADPSLPESLHDRAADCWQPLLAIADILGGAWSARSRRAAQLLTMSSEDTSEALGVAAVADIWRRFEETGCDRITSADLVMYLNGLEDRVWAELRGGAGLSPQGLSGLLKPFLIRPRKLWVDGHPLQGYRFHDFVEPFNRYVQSPGPEGRKNQTKATGYTHAPSEAASGRAPT